MRARNLLAALALGAAMTLPSAALAQSSPAPAQNNTPAAQHKTTAKKHRHRARHKVRHAAHKTAATTSTAAHNAAVKTDQTTATAAGKTERAGEKVKGTAGTAGEAVNDAWITTKVKTQFVNEGALKGSDINVDTNDHVVTLKGTVMSAAGRAKAVEIAKGTEGVHRVVDQLTIGPKK